MKKSVILLSLCMLLVGQLLGQAPGMFTYQAVVRGVSGAALPNQQVHFRFSILSGSSAGPVVFSETNLITTNAAGVANVNIGNGTPVSGTIAAINWSANLYFLKIEMDVSGGTNFQYMGVQQMVSVPYALDAGVAEMAKNLQLPFANVNSDVNTNFSIQNSAGGKIVEFKRTANYGTQPVLDLDNFSLDNNATTLRVTSSAGTTASFDAGSNGTAAYFNAPGGNAIHVNTGSVGIGTAFPQQRLDINGGIRIGNTAAQAPGSIRYNGNNFEGYNGTAWVQLNGGGSPDNWGTQTAVTNSTLTGNGTAGSPLGLSSQGANSGDVLKWNGTSWAPGTDLNGGASQWNNVNGNDLQNNNTGNVIIGNNTGGAKLNVNSTVNGLIVDANNLNTGSGIGVKGTGYDFGVQGFSNGSNGSGIYGFSGTGTAGLFATTSGYALRTSGGNVGIDVSAPEEKVEINGAIKIGTNVDLTPSNGTIRYTPTDGFEFRHANTWTAFKNLWNTTNGTDVFNLNSGNVGIGTNSPGAKLEVAGQVKITGGAPGAGKVLTSDASGLASWQTPAGGTSYTAGTGINISGSTISNTGDLSNTNEIQTLNLTGNTLTLSNGGGVVTLPSGSGSQWVNYANGIEYTSGKVKVGPTAGTIGTDYAMAIGSSTNSSSLEVYNGRTGTQVAGISSTIVSADPGSAAITGTSTLGTSTIENTHYGVLGTMDDAGIGVAAYSINGTALRTKSNTGLALHSTGNVKLTGIGEGAGKVLTSDASGNATWQTPASGTTYSAGTGINITGNTISNTGDLSNSNELQTISKTGNTISLSNGGGSVTDADAQTLSLAGNTLSISGGNSVTLPSGGGGGYWSLNGSNHIYPNNTGNVLIGSLASGSTGARFEVREDMMFGKVASFSNVTSPYTVVLEALENGTSGGPMGCVGCTGNAAIKAGANYGDAVFAYSNSRAMYIKGGSAFYPTVRIEQNTGATNPAIDMDGQIQIRGGNPGAGKVLTSDADGLATWETPSGGSSYVPGTGINISGNTISAQAATPLWNATKLYNTNVSSATPANGQVLQFNGTAWTPVTPAASSNIYDNITEHFQSGAAQATSANPAVDIPGLSKTFTISGNAKVIINSQVGLLASCIACGDHQAALELNVDGNPYVMSFYSLDNQECTQAHINKIVTVGAGTHTIKVRLIWLNGASVTAGNVLGCYSSNDVFMDAMVINQ